MPPCRLHLVADARFAIGDVTSTIGTLGLDPNSAVLAAERVSTSVFTADAPAKCEAAAAQLRRAKLRAIVEYRGHLPVHVLPPPPNSTLPVPLASEPLPSAIGHFRLAAAPPPRVPGAIAVALPLVVESDFEAAHSAGSLRSLLSLAGAPLHLHLLGSAAAIVQLLRVASRPSAHRNGGSRWRALRAHAYAALPLRLAGEYEGALRRSLPGCGLDALRADVLRLLAPLLLARAAPRRLLVLDPEAVALSEAPLALWGILERLPASHCAAVAADVAAQRASALESEDALPDARAARRHRSAPLEPAVLLLRPRRLAAAGYGALVTSALRRLLADGGTNGVGDGWTACPRALLSPLVEALRGGRRGCATAMLGCEWALQPIGHAPWHELHGLQGEADLVAYSVCLKDIVHQAFAWAYSMAHQRQYEGTACGCGQRLRLMLPPADPESGARLGARAAAAVLRAHQAEGKAETLLLAGMLWERLGAESVRWLRAGSFAGVAQPPPPDAVLAMVDREAPREPRLVLPATPTPLPPESIPHDAVDGTPVLFPCGFAGADEAWLRDVMLKGCSPRLACIGAVVRAHLAGRHAEAAATVRPGAVFVLQSQLMPIAKALAAAYRVPLASLTLVHLSDGNTYRGSVAATAASYAQWRGALRQYWLPDAAGSLDAAAARGEVRWFPIGMNPQWVRLMPAFANGSLPLPPASARRHLLTFLGSTHKSNRQARVDAVAAAARVAVHHKKGDVACYGADCDDGEYVEGTLQSALCLQLPGSSVESNRLYEQLEGGCIPVVVLAFGPGEHAVGTAPLEGDEAVREVAAALSPLDAVDGGAPPPFVVVREPSQLPAALAPFVAGGGAGGRALDAQQAKVAAWWAKAKAFYAGAFEEVACPS